MNEIGKYIYYTITFKDEPGRPGVKRSIKHFVSKSTGAIYEVIIDTNDYSYVIRNIRRERPVYRSEDIQKKEITTWRGAVRKTKKLLQQLGVDFRTARKPKLREVLERNRSKKV